MNCQNFAEIVFELADERMAILSVATRRAALAHALGCAGCGAQLQAARSLDDALTNVAASEPVAAPARVKQALLVAFEQSRAVAPAVAAAPPVRREPSGLRQLFGWRPRFSLNAGLAWTAAMILIGLASAVLLPRLLNRTDTTRNKTAVVMPTPHPAFKTNETPRSDIARVTPTATPEVKPSMRVAAIRRPRTMRPAINALPAATAADSATTDLATTGYIPLTYTTAAPQSGMVVRVEVPRASLLAMGLPVNGERATGNVKADVLMGMDGVALAIKLVNEGGGR